MASVVLSPLVGTRPGRVGGGVNPVPTRGDQARRGLAATQPGGVVDAGVNVQCRVW
jgi:hypothetical protein